MQSDRIQVGSATTKRFGLSDRHLNARTNTNNDIDSQKTQVQLYTQYYRRISRRLGLKEDIMEYSHMWENQISPMFKDKQELSNWIGANLDEVLQNSEPVSGPIRMMNNMGGQFSLSIFANFEMTFRNMLQNLPMNPNNLNMVKGLFKGLTNRRLLNDSDRKYFNEVVDQSQSIHHDIMGMDYTNQVYDMADYKFPSLIKAMQSMRGKGGGVNFNPIRFANNMAQHLNMIGRSDKFNRFGSYLGSITRQNDALKNFNLNTADRKELGKFIRKTDLNNMTQGQRQHSIYLLATKGVDAFKQYVAKEHAVYVNMDYSRDKRAPFEIGNQLNRLMGQMTTYFRGQVHQLRRMKDLFKEVKNDLKRENRNKKGYKPDAWDIADKIYINARNISGLWIGMEVGNAVLSKVVGEEKVPYRIPFTNVPTPLGITVGVMTKTVKGLNFIVESIAGSPYTDKMHPKTKTDKLIKTIVSIPKEAIPLANEVLDALDVYKGTELIEEQALKEAIEAMDKKLIDELGLDFGAKGRYVAPLPKKVRRNLEEKLQKGLFGTKKEGIDHRGTY